MATTKRSGGVVLVIEDDPAVRMVIELAVEADGLVVHGEGNGKRALEWLVENRPAIVLLDLDLPGVNGAVIAADVRQRYGQTVPILVTSGLPNCRQIARMTIEKSAQCGSPSQSMAGIPIVPSARLMTPKRGW